MLVERRTIMFEVVFASTVVAVVTDNGIALGLGLMTTCTTKPSNMHTFFDLILYLDAELKLREGL